MKYYAIIVAGGSGSRMKTDTPKQFLLLNGKPVLMHAIEAFYHSDLTPETIVVINTACVDLWKKLCEQYHFTIPHKLANNGEQRFHSVQNALTLVDENSIVAIHDAVRPIIANELITRLYQLAQQSTAVIPAVKSKDSVRKKTIGTATVALNREDILLIQTPQTFQSSVLKKAYLQNYAAAFTDDASVVEADGQEIFVTEGDYTNIKITYPEDLVLAELYLKNKS